MTRSRAVLGKRNGRAPCQKCVTCKRDGPRPEPHGGLALQLRFAQHAVSVLTCWSTL
jgi:hypothetical protein